MGTVQGIGGSLSNVVAGLIVVTAGHDAAFLTLAAVALTAFLPDAYRCRGCLCIVRPGRSIDAEQVFRLSYLLHAAFLVACLGHIARLGDEMGRLLPGGRIAMV